MAPPTADLVVDRFWDFPLEDLAVDRFWDFPPEDLVGQAWDSQMEDFQELVYSPEPA